MKRIGAILCLAMMLVMGSACIAFGAEFTVEKTSPEDGSTGMSVDNMGVKVFFTQDIYNKDNEAANAKLCTLTDNKGKVVPAKAVFSEKNKNVMLVLANTGGKDGAKIKGKTKYTLHIQEGIKAADGTVMKEGKEITFETLDPKATMTVSMVMMGVMVVGMIFFTSREAKKQAQGDAKAPKKDDKVNPYKVAKETGKSVEEIVEKDQKRKDKKAAAAAKKSKNKPEPKEETSSGNMRVKRARPISEAGSTYRHVKTKPAQDRSKSTNPKNQTGKQRNKKKK